MALDRQRIPVLEVDATPLRVPDLMAELSRFVEEGSTRTVLGHNLHSVTLTLSDEGFRDLYQRSDVVLLDGAPVLWL
ncbi:MAG: glycosyl transferase, partial [Arthrobacter sp.]|nr:glycosyl transferase [Arthrobacter sp.]